jgi:hypothetical protein
MNLLRAFNDGFTLDRTKTNPILRHPLNAKTAVGTMQRICVRGPGAEQYIVA